MAMSRANSMTRRRSILKPRSPFFTISVPRPSATARICPSAEAAVQLRLPDEQMRACYTKNPGHKDSAKVTLLKRHSTLKTACLLHGQRARVGDFGMNASIATDTILSSLSDGDEGGHSDAIARFVSTMQSPQTKLTTSVPPPGESAPSNPTTSVLASGDKRIDAPWSGVRWSTRTVLIRVRRSIRAQLSPQTKVASPFLPRHPSRQPGMSLPAAQLLWVQ